MNTNILTIANPFCDEHMALLEEFEQENELEPQITASLTAVRNSTTEAEYKTKARTDNEINITLFASPNGRITDSCTIQGAKDIKTCSIFFAPLRGKTKRSIITMATDYALTVLGMEEVFVSIRATDKNMINNLETRDFENLGEEDGYITYLKEKEDQKVNRNLVQLH